jgi:hypothetical protein
MTWEALLANSAALLNDNDQEVFTNAVQLAYLNIALGELQEIFELNNIPVTNDTSVIIEVPSSTNIITVIEIEPAIPVVGTPYYPSDLVEIQRLWQSNTGQNAWTPITRKDYLTREIIGNTSSSIFSAWAWINQEIRLLSANQDNDLKIDYIKSLFLTLAIGDLTADVTIINVATTLQFRVAGLCAEFIYEDEARAAKLNNNAGTALDRSLGISVKGRQAIAVRRRPFRASRKRRGILV